MEIMENFNEYYRYDDGFLISLKTNEIAGSMRDDFYTIVSLKNKNYLAHRVIWEMFHGPIPVGLVIDHIDGNPGNNRLSNLRLVTVSENLSNSLKRGSLPKGVTFTKGKYQAQISIQGKNKYLGRFNTPDEAETAYKVKAREVYGDKYLPTRV